MAEVKDEIRRELLIARPVDRVWRAITDPEEVNQWFGDRCAYELKAGAEGLMQWGDDAFRMRIVAIEPMRRFAYRWVTPRDGDHSIPFDEMPTTLVEFTLESTGDGTRLTLIESGFAAHPEADRGANYADNSQGWLDELGELEDYLQGK